MSCSEVGDGLNRIRELTAKIGPPIGIVTAPGLKQYETVSGKILAWTIHWQEEFAVCHAFISENSILKQHIHEEKEWIIVITGKIVIKTDTGATEIGPRAEIVIEPYTPHELSSSEDTYVVAITMPACPDWPKR